MRASTRLLSLLVCCLYISHLALATGIQYCRDEPPLCFAVASTENSTAGGHDIHVSVTATTSNSGDWVAVGIGKKMAGSLMFLVYSDQDRKGPMTSIRTVESHDNPTLLTDHERHVEMLNSSVLTSNYYAHFVCYSCDLWWKTAVPVEDKTSFIYAANRGQAFDTAASDSVLMMHDAYGIVEGDMNKALLPDPDDPIPTIRPGETTGFVLRNENGDTKSAADSSSLQSSSWPSPGEIHGFIMTVAFMGLFIPGGMVIQLALGRAFRYHWLIQLCASLLAVGSVAYMAIRSTHFGLHKILGLTVVSSLAVQAAVGYKHHAVFMQIRRQSVYSSVHRWLGRGLLLLGSLNVAFGLAHSGRPAGAILVWFIIWLVEVAGYVWVLQRKRHKKNQQRGLLVPKEEPESRLFGLADFGSEESDSSDLEEEL